MVGEETSIDRHIARTSSSLPSMLVELVQPACVKATCPDSYESNESFLSAVLRVLPDRVLLGPPGM